MRFLSLPFPREKLRLLLTIIFLILSVFIIYPLFITKNINDLYHQQLSTTIYDRNKIPIDIAVNNKGHYVIELQNIPKDFAGLLIKKEDRWFFYHPGVNPISIIRSFYYYLFTDYQTGASTITQQLSKNLLQNETNRNIRNKIHELLFSLGLELRFKKSDLLHMYANTVFMGNQIQGFETASYTYFNKPLKETSSNEQISLLATLSHPSTRNPWQNNNHKFSEIIQNSLLPNENFVTPIITTKAQFRSTAYFELNNIGLNCNTTCQTTIDSHLTEKIRTITTRHITGNADSLMKHAAVVVIDTNNNEIISLVGSSNPNSQQSGNQINMTTEPRPVGSAIKPFIYLQGFENGLRPYSTVEDREYKYPIATGYSLYPKNYDGLYRGTVTLHQSLSNSLNVPTVKVLEYVELEQFYDFLSNRLHFKPIQPYDAYQYGIALGGLEMDLLTLSYFFTIFPNRGVLYPLSIGSDTPTNMPPQAEKIIVPERVAEESDIELVHVILRDRHTGVDQFGAVSNLNVPQPEYGVKTGTSRDYHDGWVIGYTPDYVVGVWVGNTENQAMRQVTGSTGAGAIWSEVMSLLYQSDYHHQNSFTLNHAKQLTIGKSSEWGYDTDTINHHQNLLSDDHLILSIHAFDTFKLTSQTHIPLRARREVEWTINGDVLIIAKEATFQPTTSGQYQIIAFVPETGQREIITITITD